MWTDRERDRETERDTERERQRERERACMSVGSQVLLTITFTNPNRGYDVQVELPDLRVPQDGMSKVFATHECNSSPTVCGCTMYFIDTAGY